MMNMLNQIPRSGSKAEDGEKREKKREKDQTMAITMAKLRMAQASTHGARNRLGQNMLLSYQLKSILILCAAIHNFRPDILNLERKEHILIEWIVVFRSEDNSPILGQFILQLEREVNLIKMLNTHPMLDNQPCF